MLYFLLINYLIISANSQCYIEEPPSPLPPFPLLPPLLFPPPSQPSTPSSSTPTLNLGSCSIQQPQITSLYLTYEYLDDDYLDDRVKFTVKGWDNDSLPPNQRAKTKFNLVPLIPKYIYFGHPIENPQPYEKSQANYYTGNRWSCDDFNFDYGGSGLNVDRINLFETSNLTNISIYVDKQYVERYLLDANRMLTYGFMTPSSSCTTNDLNKQHCWCPVLTLIM
jgi:hypothetical protein